MIIKYGLDVSTAGEYSDPRVLADLAAQAEAAGWDSFFIWDVVYPRINLTYPWPIRGLRWPRLR
jgi:alkanesulfonate monooxygenase SsuD/methylene tetrahydromethanopterin reductase-like flavin-dependent oxidoreductase (luciferase family)